MLAISCLIFVLPIVMMSKSPLEEHDAGMEPSTKTDILEGMVPLSLCPIFQTDKGLIRVNNIPFT